MSEPIAITADRVIPFYPLPPSTSGLEITIKVPTPDQRDMLSTTLNRLGLRPITQELMRATLIDALYDRGDDAQADADAEMLEEFWQVSRLDEEALADWHEREIQRQRDIADGAPHRPPVPMPVPLVRARLKARARLLVDEMTTDSPRMVALLERQMDYNRMQAYALVRIGIADVKGAAFAIERGSDGHLTQETAQAIREALSDTHWLQLIEQIDHGYRLTVDEEKNSDWLLEKQSDPNGSAEPSDASASSDGKWTESNTGQTPDAASVTTTG